MLWAQGGAQNQALGRSRGGFSTKIHLRANAHGLPVGVVLTTGQVHDVTAYDDVVAERDSDPGMVLADKGYDSDAVRQDLLDLGAAAEIPTKSNRKVQHIVNKRLYTLRARIEFLTNGNTDAVLQPSTTKHRRASLALFCLAASASGSGLSTQPGSDIETDAY